MGRRAPWNPSSCPARCAQRLTPARFCVPTESDFYATPAGQRRELLVLHKRLHNLHLLCLLCCDHIRAFVFRLPAAASVYQILRPVRMHFEHQSICCVCSSLHVAHIFAPFTQGDLQLKAPANSNVHRPQVVATQSDALTLLCSCSQSMCSLPS